MNLLATLWNDSYPSGGNYWSGYTGVDDRSGPYQNLLGSDGIGDSPYTIDAITSDIDHYPLMKACPWIPLSVTTTPVSVTMDVGQSQLFTSAVSGGTSPFNYQWCLNDVAVPEASSSAWTFVPNCAGSYNVYVNVTDSLSLTAKSNTTTITVNLALSVGILPTPSVMDLGQSQLFISSISGGTSPYTYQWYLNGSAVSEATSSWTFTPSSSDSFTIYVDVTDSIGANATSNDATITVNAAPSVSISPSSVNLDIGQSQMFTSTVSGGAFPYFYQWCLDSVPVSEAAGATWTFTPVSSGFYMVCVNVTDVLGAVVTSNIVPVTVNGPLLVSMAPGSVVLDMGQSQLFTSAVSGGTSPFNYQWCLNDVAVPALLVPRGRLCQVLLAS